MDLTEAQIASITRWAEETPLIRAAILVGSRAKETSRPDSDVDLAIRLAVQDMYVEDTFLYEGGPWQARLSSETGLKVSLLHLAGFYTPIHEAAVTDHGIELYRAKSV